VKDWQPTPSLGAIPVGGRLFCWRDRGMEILHRLGIARPSGWQEQVSPPHMLGATILPWSTDGISSRDRR
jgi:hypothetical protein